MYFLSIIRPNSPPVKPCFQRDGFRPAVNIFFTKKHLLFRAYQGTMILNVGHQVFAPLAFNNLLGGLSNGC